MRSECGDAWVIHHGDVREVVAAIDADSFDAVLCDPPYGLRFMAKRWDYDVPSRELWADVLRVCKPGAPLLAFGGTRTFHRLVCAVEDGGWEVRDTLAWLYGEGFPKSLDVSKAIDKVAGAEREVVGTRVLTGNAAVSTKEKGGTYGVQVGTAPPKRVDVTAPATYLAKRWDGYGSALKPSFEPIVLARKPLDGTIAANVARWGVGGLAIDACRIGNAGGTTKGNPPKGPSNGIYGNGINGACDIVALDAGRWPANLLLDETAAEMLDAQSGERRNGGQNATSDRASRGVTYRLGGDKNPTAYAGDSGGASRFFFVAKTSRAERELGCGVGTGDAVRNHHPTLKPVALTRWLARLVLPPPHADGTPRRILVPFAGSGSEMIGALLAGWDEVVGIEREAEYVAIAQRRVGLAASNPRAWEPDAIRKDEGVLPGQVPLFGGR